MAKVGFGQIASIFRLGCLILIVPELAFAAEERGSEMWTLLANWFPMLLVIGVWIYFMKNPKMKKVWGQSEEINRHLEKIEQTLERIARLLEKK